MKTSIVLITFLFSVAICFAQKPSTEKSEKGLKGNQIPSVVQTAFAKAFPNASSVKWSKESVSEFEAEFILGGKETSSNFDQSGKWVATETEIESSELPQAVTATLLRDFAGYKINEAEKVETPDKGTYYEVALAKGKAKVGLEVSADGKVMKKEG